MTTTILLCVIGALAALCIIFLKEARAANAKVRILKGYWEEEREARRKVEREHWDIEGRYGELMAAYKEVAEIEEGEDYVRRSLGLPPEDQEESA